MSYKPPQKIVFSTPSVSGFKASISTTSHTVTLTNGSGFTSAMNDGYIIINGANTPLSNGVFQIAYVSSTSVTWTNPNVASGTDSYNGFIVWSIAQTWTAPPDVNYVELTLIGGGAGGGGGGGGGGGSGHTLGYGGGGGSSGSYGTSGQLQIVSDVQVIPGTTYYISVGNNGTGGAGGAGGAAATIGVAGSDGYSGTPSQFMFTNGLAYLADGGQGGEANTYKAGMGGLPGNPGGTFAGGPGGASNGGDGSQEGYSGGDTSATIQNNQAVTPDTTAGAIYNIYSTAAIPPASFATASQTNLTESYALSQGMFGALSPNAIDRTGSNPSFSNSAGSAGTTPFFPASSTSFVGSSTNAPGGAGGVLDMTSFLPLYIIGTNLNTISNDGITFPYLIDGSLGNGGLGATAGSTPTSASIGFWSNSIATIFGYGAGGLGGPGGGGGGGSTSGPSAGGAGYQGDQGLPGVVIISW